MDELLIGLRIVGSIVTLFLFYRQRRRYERKLRFVMRIAQP